MTMLSVFISTLLLVSTSNVTTMISITGNSVAQMQGGFQTDMWPLYPAGDISIFGQYSMTCNELLQEGPTGLPLILAMAPASSQVIVLYDVGNDIHTGVPLQTHIACMQQTIKDFYERNPSVKIVITNQLPWGQGFLLNGQWYQRGDDGVLCAGYFDARAVIAQYNQAYATTNWNQGLPAGTVTLVDVWTPNALPNGFGDPQYIKGGCLVHPDLPNQWTPAWQHFTAPVVQAVNTLLGDK
jgi:hypothetical protein